MFNFTGYLSSNCKLHFAKLKNAKISLIFFVYGLIFSLIVLTIGIIYNKVLYASLVCIILILPFIISFILPHNKIANTKIFVDILFDNNFITMKYNSQKPVTKKINSIKKIIEFPDWFYIIFKWGDITNAWVCEKKLLKYGTIEYFKKVFKNKIVSKIE